MNKLHLTSLIDKYYLKGIGEKVKWTVKDNTVTIKTFSAAKDMVGVINAPIELEDGEFVIFDTSKFVKLVNICNQFITMDIQFEGKIATKLLVADNEYNLEYALANLMLAPQVNFTVEEFEHNYSISITDEFINKWIKAKKALSSTTCLIELVWGDIGAKVFFTLGESEGHSNKVTFEETPKEIVKEGVKLSFNADYLEAIFDANRKCEGTMYINNEGAMKLEFKNEDEQKSSYILLAKI
jgi:hypothetical protein